MADQIYINMLGEFTMTCGSNVISDQDNRSRKVWTLLEYLITFHSREVSRDALIELLWPGSVSRADSENALKTILHRARAALGELGCTEEKLILHRRGSFVWNPDVALILDTELFEQSCRTAAGRELSEDARLDAYRKALSLYKGRFLPKNADDDWAIPVAEYFHSLYLNAVHEFIELLLASGSFEEIIRLCRRACSIDPYDEPVRYHLIRSLYITGKQKEALQEYQHVLQLFYDTYGINPSDEITALYQEITKEEHSPAADLSAIRERLREQNAQQRAYFCDFSVFQNLYRIEARSAARSGFSVFLCLISLNAERESSDNALMASAMAKMGETIGRSLRAGDVYSRYSVNQYIIMLSAANYENCTQIGLRILKAFQNAKPRLNVTADYALSELEPLYFKRTDEAGAAEDDSAGAPESAL